MIHLLAVSHQIHNGAPRSKRMQSNVLHLSFAIINLHSCQQKSMLLKYFFSAARIAEPYHIQVLFHNNTLQMSNAASARSHHLLSHKSFFTFWRRSRSCSVTSCKQIIICHVSWPKPPDLLYNTRRQSYSRA